MSTLRQKKAAATRIGLLRAAMVRLDDRPLADISVKELCAEVGVSQPTFFNYFASKDDLLLLFVQLWSVEMAWVAAQQPADDPLGAIEAVFEHTARPSEDRPGLLGEILAWQARQRAVVPDSLPTDADLLLFYPDHDGILDVPRGSGMHEIFLPRLRSAIAMGALPADTDPTRALAAVATVFLGAPILWRQVPGLSLADLYRDQLRLVWAGLRG